tara:strand:- start:2027 stop:2905 length:879 start_codon:yes stop_codon:yes gene_type:complete
MSCGSVKVVKLQGEKPVTPSKKKPVNPSEKKEKRLKKRIRTKEQRFQETKDENYLRERDQAQDELNELLLSRTTAKKNKKIKEKKKKKLNLNVSDDQAFLEAEKYNRSVKDEALREQEKKKMKAEELRGKRAFAKEKLQEKKEKMKKKNLSLKERLQENEEKKKNWELYRSLFEQEYMVEYSKEHPYETPELGQIDLLAKKNYEQELEIKQKEAGIKAYEEEFKMRKSMLQSYIDQTDMPCGDKGQTIRNMNAHLENQIKEVRDSYPKVLKVLDKWVAKLQVVQDVEDSVSE